MGYGTRKPTSNEPDGDVHDDISRKLANAGKPDPKVKHTVESLVRRALVCEGAVIDLDGTAAWAVLHAVQRRLVERGMEPTGGLLDKDKLTNTITEGCKRVAP